MPEFDLPRPEELEPHPIALLFPDCSPEENRELARRIKANGLRQDIWLYEDAINGGPKKLYILDGRRRNAACVVENVEPRYRIYTGDDPLGFAVDLNHERRHMERADRKRLAKELFKAAPAKTDNAVATQAGISPHTARKAREEAEAETTAANLQNANNDAAAPPPAQPRERVERGPGGSPALKKDGAPRQARGRKPGPTVAARTPKEAKPKSVQGSRRDRWVVDGAALVASVDVDDTLYAFTAILRDHTGHIQATMSDARLNAWLEQTAAAVGRKIVS